MWLPVVLGTLTIGIGAMMLAFRSGMRRDYTHGLVVGDSMLATPILTHALREATGFPWDNVAVSGSGSDAIRRQFVSSFRPGVHDIVLISIGGNDGERPLSYTQNNVMEIMRNLGTADAIIFSEPPLRGYRRGRFNAGALRRSAGNVRWVLGGGSGARHIVDLARIIGDGQGSLRRDYDGGDGLHPNRAGRVAMAQAVARKIG